MGGFFQLGGGKGALEKHHQQADGQNTKDADHHGGQDIGKDAGAETHEPSFQLSHM